MIIRLLVYFLPVCFLLRPLGPQPIDVLHYKFEIGLNDENNFINGKATITFRAEGNTDHVRFDLKDVLDGKGMQVLKVSRDENGNSILSYSHLHEKLDITLQHTLQGGQEDTVTIWYKGVPADGLIISKNKYGHRTFFGDNWPDRGHNWIPCIEDPADKASVEFIVTAPQHYQVIANGVQTEESNLADGYKITHWTEDVPISTKVMVIGVAEFAVNLSGVVNDCIPVYSWVYPEDRDKGFYDYGMAGGILKWYIDKVGPYGYKKLANVQSKTMFGGLENANTIFYSEGSVTGTRKSEALLAHEIAHQWFGNMATEKSFAHLWLSEGFATYMTIQYLENKYGTDTLNAMLKEDRIQVINYSKRSKQPVVDQSVTDYMKLLNENSYQKGGWVLHMLRRQLGETVFQVAIRTYYETYAGKTASTDDLRAVFESVSGKDLRQFFSQWLYTPGQPILNISWTYDLKGKQIHLTVKQVQAGVPFSFPLEIGVVNADGTTGIRKVEVNNAIEIFSIPVSQKPQRLVPDPNISLLYELAEPLREIK